MSRGADPARRPPSLGLPARELAAIDRATARVLPPGAGTPEATEPSLSFLGVVGGMLAAWRNRRRLAELVRLAAELTAGLEGALTSEAVSPQAQGLTVAQLDTGEIGYYGQRRDDCVRPCVATALQVPIEEVPDPRLDERLAAGDSTESISRDAWTALAAWLDARGLRLAFHEPSHAATLERWIGVCVHPADRALQAAGVEVAPEDVQPFGDHCVVCRYDRIIFDPAVAIEPPPGHRVRAWRLSDMSYALSFQPTEE